MAYTALQSPIRVLDAVPERAVEWYAREDIPNDFFDQFLNLESANMALANSSDDDCSSTLLSLPESALMSSVPPSSSSTSLLSPGRDPAAVVALACSATKMEPGVKPEPGLPASTASSDAMAAQKAESIMGSRGSPAPGCFSISDSELLQLEGISLRPSRVSPILSTSNSTSNPSSTTAVLKGNRFVEAISSTGRKAATICPEGRQQGSATSANSLKFGSPEKATRLRLGQLSIGNKRLPLSLQPDKPAAMDGSEFTIGTVEDPFHDPNVAPFSTAKTRNSRLCIPTARLERSEVESGMALYRGVGRLAAQPPTPSMNEDAMWSTSICIIGAVSPDDPWNTNFTPLGMTNSDMTTGQNDSNATSNIAMHMQHAELPYESIPTTAAVLAPADTSRSGHMVHMPQPRTASTSAVDSLARSASTHLAAPQTGRRSRARAPSSAGRHRAFSSPMRKARVSARSESASPAPTRNSRHSSSESSRSASGGSGSLASLRKRRSFTPRREPRTPNPTGGGGGGCLDQMDFVNFTPQDSSLLMAGVAPSGSSKTKARREKEAIERRQRLSEAAVKAVKAAGGDVEKLLVQEGFVF